MTGIDRDPYETDDALSDRLSNRFEGSLRDDRVLTVTEELGNEVAATFEDLQDATDDADALDRQQFEALVVALGLEAIKERSAEKILNAITEQ